MNAGSGDGTFAINGSGLVSKMEVWRGWLGTKTYPHRPAVFWLIVTACDWWHGVPQLFWMYYFSDVKFPSSCAKVELHHEAHAGNVGAQRLG